MVKPTSGQCYLQGQLVGRSSLDIWNDVGYIVETPYSYPELTVRENLEIVRRLRGIEDRARIDWIINKLKLMDHKFKKVKHLSQGNLQRLGLAKALIHKPKILLLDEPTNGLDPAAIVEVRQLLRDLVKDEGVTILISSHKLNEISKIATNIGIIHRGQLIKKIGGKEIARQLKSWLTLDGNDIGGMKSILIKAGYKPSVKKEDLVGNHGLLHIHDNGAVNAPDKIANLLVNSGYPPTLLKVEREDLEMYFLRILEECGGVKG